MAKRYQLLAVILVFVACLPASTLASTTITIWDKTTIDVYNPKSNTVSGPKDVEGDVNLFQTSRIDVELSGTDVKFFIYTNLPKLLAYPSFGTIYRPADLAIDLDVDGRYETGITLYNSASYFGYFPHASRLAVYQVNPDTGWYKPSDFYNNPTSPVYKYKSTYGFHAQGGDHAPPTYFDLDTIVGIKAAPDTRLLAWASVDWWSDVQYSPYGDTKYRIDIVLRGINVNGDWNTFNLFWGTATCANDSIAGYVPIPATVWLLASGLIGLAGLRRRTRT